MIVDKRRVTGHLFDKAFHIAAAFELNNNRNMPIRCFTDSEEIADDFAGRRCCEKCDGSGRQPEHDGDFRRTRRLGRLVLGMDNKPDTNKNAPRQEAV